MGYSGFAWFGGLVFGISALVFQGWRAKIGALRTLDLAAPAAAIGYGLGRIGCFLSGDGCYGIPTNLPWGMSFPHGIEPTLVRVHPTPLYELAAALLIGWLALVARRKAARNRARFWASTLCSPALPAFWSSSSAATPRFCGDCRMRNWPAPARSLRASR